MFTTIVEVELFHLMRDPADPDNEQLVWPSPDEVLTPTANTPVKALTGNGLLLWLSDGSVVHASWCSARKSFTRRDGGGALSLSAVKAWGALDHPIAPL